MAEPHRSHLADMTSALTHITADTSGSAVRLVRAVFDVGADVVLVSGRQSVCQSPVWIIDNTCTAYTRSSALGITGLSLAMLG